MPYPTSPTSSRAITRWKVLKRADADLLKHLCLVRGLDPGQLQPDFTAHLHDPNLLPDMEKARALIREAKEKNWHVTIFGDYDADGTPAAALLSLVFKKIGLNHRVILPTRYSGYGLRQEVIEEIAGETQLLITVDTGISATEEIALAKQKGLKVIVLDHHLPPADLPPADALVDPYLSHSQYPFKHLCGCALAYKLAVALCEDFKPITDGFCKWLLDLVAISTVTDMMPLIDENRALVHYGLKVLAQTKRPGLQALIETAGLPLERLNAGSLGFVIGPRLNASGRLSSNQPAFDLLLAETPEAAQLLAAEVETANRQRQEIVEEVLNQADQFLWQQNDRQDLVLTVLGDGWPPGVVGLVAGKLAGRYFRPVIVGTSDGLLIKASARSIPDYPLVDNLQKNAGLLESFGGHRQAAGLSLNPGKWEEFSQSLKSGANEFIAGLDFQPVVVAEALLEPADLDLTVAEGLEQLEPFGLANPKPQFIIADCQILQTRSMGRENTHLKLQLDKDGRTFDAVGFGLAKQFPYRPGQNIDILGQLDRNTWNGQTKLQIKIIDYHSTGANLEVINEVENYFRLP